MTYPPQQPPQGDPFGQQPGRPGEQGDWGQQQQPGSGQQPGQQPGQPGQPPGQQGPQPGQHPGPGPQPGQPGQPGGQPGQFPGGQPGQFPGGQPDQPGYGQPPGQQFGQPPGGFGQPPGYPPAQKRSALPWILGGVGLLVVIALAIGAFVLLGGSGGNDPRDVAQTVVDEMNKLENANAGTIENQLCNSQKEAFRKEFDDFVNGFKELKAQAGSDFTAKFSLGDVRTEGDTGSFDIIAEASFQGESNKETIPAQLVREDGDWKVCDLQG